MPPNMPPPPVDAVIAEQAKEQLQGIMDRASDESAAREADVARQQEFLDRQESAKERIRQARESREEAEAKPAEKPEQPAAKEPAAKEPAAQTVTAPPEGAKPSIPEELTYDAHAAGLDDDEIAFYGDDHAALQKRVAFALKRAMAKPAQGTPDPVPGKAQANPAAQSLPAEQKPAAAATPAEDPLIAHLDPDTKALWIAREKQHKEQMQAVLGRFDTLEQRLEQDRNATMAQRAHSIRQWIHDKVTADPQAEHLKDEQAIDAAMGAFATMAASKNLPPLSAEQLYARARNLVLSDKGIPQQQAREDARKSIDARKRQAIPGPARTARMVQTSEKKTPEQAKEALRLKLRGQF